MDLYLKSDLPEKTYFQCLTFLCFRGYEKVCRRIIKDKVNDNNISLAIDTFENFFNLKKEEKTDLFKEIIEILKEIKNKLVINQFINREPYIKDLTDDKIINITGESGSGKSYFSNKYINDDDYIVIDTDIVFSNKQFNNKESLEIRDLFKNKSKDDFINDFDNCYLQILNYFKDCGKTIVIDSAQFRNIQDYSILKGKIIIIRTCINTCYERCLNRWKLLNKNYKNEEFEKYTRKKEAMYKWYKSLNKFIENVDKLHY